MKVDNDSAIINITDVTLPIVSFGACKYWRKCDNVQVDLGSGVCVECYDKGLDRYEGTLASKSFGQ